MATRYDDRITLKTDQGKPYIKGKQYPNIPLSENDIYVITTIGDRLDSLAYSYYRGSMFPVPGTQLRIPTDLSSVLRLFNQFNQAR
jgi:hypothetical protein